MPPCSRRQFLAGAMAWPLGTKADEPPPDLAGRTLGLRIATIAPCRATAIAADMAPSFTAWAKAERRYDVSLEFAPAPVPERPWGADTHLVLAPTPLLSRIAAPKWVAPLNTLVQIRPALDVAWAAPIVRESFQLFPETSANRYGIPQSGDALVLFIRSDMLEAAHLPTGFDEWQAMTWPAFRQVLAALHRPDRAAWIAPLTGDPDGFSAAALALLLSAGGRLWDPATGQVEGVFNTRANALALADYLALAAYQPVSATGWTAAQAIERFAAGDAAITLQWASAGPALIPADLAGKVAAVPLPGFPAPDGAIQRRAPVGGRLWGVNAAADPLHAQAAADLLEWWCRPETSAEFARRGGLPCDRATLDAPGFDDAEPWHRAYKLMLANGTDLWRDPRYDDLLDAQHAMLAAVLSGHDVMSAVQALACREQELLFDEGSADHRPGPGCRTL